MSTEQQSKVTHLVINFYDGHSFDPSYRKYTVETREVVTLQIKQAHDLLKRLQIVAQCTENKGTDDHDNIDIDGHNLSKHTLIRQTIDRIGYKNTTLNFECCGGYGGCISSYNEQENYQFVNSEYSTHTVDLIVHMLKMGAQVICADFASKALIQNWDADKFGVTCPFKNVGSECGSVRVSYAINPCKDCQFPQLSSLASMALPDKKDGDDQPQSSITMEAMGNTIVYAIKKEIDPKISVNVMSVAVGKMNRSHKTYPLVPKNTPIDQKKMISEQDFPTFGLSDHPTFGLSDHQTVGLSDQPTFGLSDHQTVGLSDHQTVGLSDQPTVGLSDQPTVGLSDHPAFGLSDQPTVGLSDHPAFGLSDQPTVGLSDHPAFGLSDCPAVGCPDFFSAPSTKKLKRQNAVGSLAFAKNPKNKNLKQTVCQVVETQVLSDDDQMDLDFPKIGDDTKFEIEHYPKNDNFSVAMGTKDLCGFPVHTIVRFSHFDGSLVVSSLHLINLLDVNTNIDNVISASQTVLGRERSSQIESELREIAIKAPQLLRSVTSGYVAEITSCSTVQPKKHAKIISRSKTSPSRTTEKSIEPRNDQPDCLMVDELMVD
jgi:hypothetical protein